MIFGTCKLHTTRSGVMQILSKFCHNKHLTRDYRSAHRHERHLLHSVMASINFCYESVKALSAPSFAGKFLQKAARAPVLLHP